MVHNAPLAILRHWSHNLLQTAFLHLDIDDACVELEMVDDDAANHPIDAHCTAH